MLGSLSDYIIARGDLSPENQAIFEQIAKDLGIADRDIKAKDSGLIFRLFTGYHNAMAHQLTNRAYFNDSELNKLSREERKFIMAHELTHHQNHDHFCRIFLKSLCTIAPMILAHNNILNKNSSYLNQYLLNGWSILDIVNLNIWQLLFAQCAQCQERAADANALLCTDIDIQDATGALQYLHYPNTEGWPLYAKVTNFIVQYLRKFLSLPILKEHFPHLVSFDERVAALKKHHKTDQFVFSH